MKEKIWCAKYLVDGSAGHFLYFSFWATSKGMAVDHAGYIARMRFNLGQAPRLSSPYKLVECKVLKNGDPFQCGHLTSYLENLVRME